MGIEATYRNTAIENFIRESLRLGVIPSFTDLESFTVLLADRDFTKPQFSADDFAVASGEPASVEKFKDTMNTVYQDLKILFIELKRIGKVIVNLRDQWETETLGVESSLVELESRVGNLLLLARDTEGYINFVSDDLRDLSKIDAALSSVTVDPASRIAFLPVSEGSYLSVHSSLTEEDVSFRIVSKTGTVSANATSSELLNAFSDLGSTWQTRVVTTQQEVVTGSLIVHLSDEPISFSRIEFRAHVSSGTSPLLVTALYSTDGFNYSQIPGDPVTIDIRDIGNFFFEEVAATHVKFSMIKTSPDYSNENRHSYEFGARQIKFFSQAFDTDSRPVLISNPLSVVDSDGEAVEFSKLSLSTCETVPTNTNLSFSVFVSNDPDAPVDEDTSWINIDPEGREEKQNNPVIDVGDLNTVIVGDDETLTISYDSISNPSDDFFVIWNNEGELETEHIEPPVDEVRYNLVNSCDRLLNYQLNVPKYSIFDDPTMFVLDATSIILLRNIGEKGLLASDLRVRGVQRGWKFEDPYYSCVVEVDAEDGLSINAGDEYLWLDEIKQKQNVLIPFGIHKIKVHKNNWVNVTPSLDDLSSLSAADSLFPYNHKLLIEGYLHGENFPESDMIYQGVDWFAENQMEKVGILDFVNNVARTDYVHFATDFDLPGSYGNVYPSMVFLVKVDENMADNVNERFLLKFRTVDQKYRYLRLKAEFSTLDPKLTPVLTSYKIKLG